MLHLRRSIDEKFVTSGSVARFTSVRITIALHQIEQVCAVVQIDAGTEAFPTKCR
jgi:hypothetical protein